MKNFYIYNTFFNYMIDVYIIALIIETIDYKNINKFWL